MEALERARIVPILSVATVEQAERACAALVAGGISCVEITLRTDAAIEAIRRASEIAGLLIGAGTVLSPQQASKAAEAGARFTVAPGMNAAVVAACAELDLPHFPGVATPSEIEHARGIGCRTLKVFPISLLGGTEFIRAVSATYRDIRFLPTGGIGPADAIAYLALPAVVACGGSWLCTRELLDEGRYDEIERLAREAVAMRAR